MNRSIIFSLMCLLLVSACSEVKQIPLTAEFIQKDGSGFELVDSVKVCASTGIATELHANTQWKLKGEISEGMVYKTSDQAVTAKGVNQHEAFIVVKDGKIVGFYLPVENTFSPTQEVSILTKAIN